MGLFSRHKKEEKTEVAPSVPPLPPIENTKAVSTENKDTLPAPSMPNPTLDDIKAQVTSEVEIPKINELPQISDENLTNLDSDSQDLSIDDSLFDFSNVEISENEDNSTILPQSNEGEIEIDDENTNTNFINNESKNHLTHPNKENYFVNATQFKTLLEIVESVKERTKNSSDSHLRLLDIKSEEDIEYENLRKDFQFIEDKLYELDSIIFEK